MRPESYKIFAQLLEGFVNEASTSLDLITGSPGGQEVIVKLHKDMRLAHDQNYKQVDKISWSELKGSYRGAWVIIVGSKGTGAIKAKGDSYEALASAGGEPQLIRDGRGGNILDFLKGEIGKLQKFYVGKVTSSDLDDKKRKRDDAQRNSANEVSVETLTKKFKPLWSRAITSAIADIKGHIANQIKNDAFEKAEKKLSQVRNLQNALDMLEAGDTDTPGSVTNAINTAVIMAASHHYPEQTGTINRSGYGRGGYNAQFPEGPKQLLKDISAGDQKKLGTVLGFFKRTLISG
jgi:hypothetical protein